MARVNAFGLDELFNTFKKEGGAIDKETGKKMLEAGIPVIVLNLTSCATVIRSGSFSSCVYA